MSCLGSHSDLLTALEECPKLSTEAKDCIVNEQIGTQVTATSFSCKEVEPNTLIEPNNVIINGTGVGETEEAINVHLCTLYGAYLAASDSSFWTADQTNGYCILADTCTNIDFASTNTIVGTPDNSVCVKMKYRDGDDVKRCKANASDACEPDPAKNCMSVETVGTFEEMITGCADSEVWTVEEDDECIINHDQTGTQCAEYAIDDEVLSTSVDFGSVSAGDKARCFLLQQEYDSKLDANDNTGWKSSEAGGCEDATECSEIEFEDSAGISASPPSGTLCKNLVNSAGSECDGEEGELKCSAKEGPPPSGQQCSALGTISDTNLLDAIATCSAGVTDANTDECRVNVDLTADDFGCMSNEKATYMLAADVKVDDDEASDALCAYMGYTYGEDKVNAWKRTGGACEAIVIEGTCDQVTWKGFDATKLGSFSDWSSMCENIQHMGYTEDGTEGAVTCQYAAEAETCSSAVAIFMGAITAFITTLI